MHDSGDYPRRYTGHAADTYLTILGAAEFGLREKGSRFLALAYPAGSEQQAEGYVEGLRKRFHDATHHCYAWRLGVAGERTRSNDDGEPSGSAGRPIMGRIVSAGLTDVAVVVVRWFGGTKLGVPGLTKAYRESAAGVLDACEVVERTVDACVAIEFPFESLDSVLKAAREGGARLVEQHFDNICRMTLLVRLSGEAALRKKLDRWIKE